jgi:hypothetical protein
MRGAPLLLLALLAPFLSLPAAAPHAAATVREVFVGDNWAGTIDVLHFDPASGEFTRVAMVNAIPDIDARMAEIESDPVKLGYFLAVRELIGEGHDQFVDDVYSTNDGTTLMASRPSLADVVGIDVATGSIVWRFVMDGHRSDHMGLSPDGTRLAVSDSTANVVHVLDTADGHEVWRFDSGDSPHENTWSRDGTHIFHASIGLVYTPLDEPAMDATKGVRYFQVVNASTMQVEKRWTMGEKLAEAGYPDESSAVRPMALAPDERYVYFQWSFFHGFAEFDLQQEKVTRVADLPNAHPETLREQYVLDSAHHGLAMDGAGTQLCVAGTMDDYAMLVNRADFRVEARFDEPAGARPYWATSSDDGHYCFMSFSGLDRVTAFSYDTDREAGSIATGDHPQRIRTGEVRSDWVAQQG